MTKRTEVGSFATAACGGEREQKGVVAVEGIEHRRMRRFIRAPQQNIAALPFEKRKQKRKLNLKRG